MGKFQTCADKCEYYHKHALKDIQKARRALLRLHRYYESEGRDRDSRTSMHMVGLNDSIESALKAQIRYSTHPDSEFRQQVEMGAKL